MASGDQANTNILLQPARFARQELTVRKNKYMLEVSALIIVMISFALDCSAKETLFYQSQLKGCYSPKPQQ